MSSLLQLLPLSDSAPEAHQKADDGADQKNDEQNLRDAGGAGGDTAESEERRDQCDDKKHHCIVKHERTFLSLRHDPRAATVRPGAGGVSRCAQEHTVGHYPRLGMRVKLSACPRTERETSARPAPRTR